jgi:ADP-glucose pyrophosphorylase
MRRGLHRAPTAVVMVVLWDRVRVGDRAVLSHCVVTDDVAIPEDARYDRAASLQRVFPLGGTWWTRG